MRAFAFVLALSLSIVVPARAAGPAVATGASHSLAVHADGTVRSWGDDSFGALGLGRALATATPTAVAGLTDVMAVAAGDIFTVALKSDGTVWAWGGNGGGELGDGTNISRSTPAQVIGLTDVKQISAGRYHVMALRTDGTVWTWGANFFGELGEEVPARNRAGPVPGLVSVVEVAAGGGHSLARTADGVVLAWGRNDSGQLGDGTVAESYSGRARPMPVVGLDNVAQLSAGGFHSVARKKDGSVWAWGENSYGEVGDGTTMSPRSMPVPVTGLSGVLEVSAGFTYTVARKDDGSVWIWGWSPYGVYPDGSYDAHPTPTQLPGIANVSQISVGLYHSLARASDGGLWAWGANDSGALGDGTTQSHQMPTRISGVSGLAMVATGAAFSVALRDDRTVLTWGGNSSGQLGNAAITFRSTPTVVPGLTGVSAVAAGETSSFAVTRDGRVYEWGNRLGYGVGKSAPVEVAGLTNVVEVTAGRYHIIARLSDGTLQGWGSNYLGALALGDDIGQTEPVPIPGITNVTRVSAGRFHTLAVRSDGTVWAWGDNSAGQLGDGTTTNRSRPVQVPGLANAVEVIAAADHSIALLADGSVWAWGGNSGNEVTGDNDPIIVAPRRVVGLPAATAIAGGSQSSFALSGGRLWAWGYNYYAGIGCPACDGRKGPIQVPGVDRIASVSAFLDHVLLLREDGGVYAFGLGTLGQLGDGTLVTRDSPVVVLREGGAGSIAGNDWFLDLDPAAATQIAADKIPTFLVVASNQANNLVAEIRYRAQDVGTTASTFVFALAPANKVAGAAAAKSARFGALEKGEKDSPVQCVLAQLNLSGQLQAVSASSLQAYVTGVLAGQGQSVTILNGTSAATIDGATFFVGYGSSANSMLADGTNRGVVSVAGASECKPQAPQTGWWWNTNEAGRGYSIEVSGNHIFYASYLYDVTGRATWLLATGNTSLDGSLFTGDLYSFSGGQTLGGASTGVLPPSQAVGPVTLAFSDASHGTMSWPGGNVAIERFNIVPSGLMMAHSADEPQSGWWWNSNEPGRGFFLEWQGRQLFMAGYMYDDAGEPIWYLSGDAQPSMNVQSYSNVWQLLGDGQTLMGTYRSPMTVNPSVAPVTIQFQGAENAIMTLPGGRTTSLTRYRF